MYTHISMFRFRDRNDLDSAREQVKARLLEFPAHIPSIADCWVTENILAQPGGSGWQSTAVLRSGADHHFPKRR